MRTRTSSSAAATSGAAHVVGRLGVGLGYRQLAALLRDLGALRPHLALDLRDALVDPGEIGRRGAVAARRDFTSLMADASFSPCARVAASSRAAPRLFFPAPRSRAAARIGHGLADLGSSPATRAVRPSIGGTELRAGGRRGLNRRPAQHPADADHQRSRDRAGDRRDDPGRDRPGRRSAPAIPRRPLGGLGVGSRLGALGVRSAALFGLARYFGRLEVDGRRLALRPAESGSDPVSSGLSSTIAAVPLNG
jgi:hypothetical protein